jgi:HlyD family secretion protein
VRQSVRKWIAPAIVLAVLALAAVLAWQRFAPRADATKLASANGRIEAVEIDIAAKSPGRVREIRVAEGEFVEAGQIVAVMDAETLEAQHRQAEAQLAQSRSSVDTARSVLTQREGERAAAQAAVAQRDVERVAAQRQLARSAALAEKGFISPKALDDDRTRVDAAEAAVRAAKAQVAAADAGIASARSQIASAEAAAVAAQANVERLRADIDDLTLKAPRAGRVQYRVAQPGEVVAAGGKIVNLIDLSDVYMTFFLPTAIAGRLALGAEARLVLDAAPQYVVPARISFVAAEAQFTPKTVETAAEREKLMFRVKASIAPELLQKYITRVKAGLPGMAYVRLDEASEWPERLRVKLPP